MEFTNEISFNQKLTKNEPAKITYNGFLAKEGSNSVSIVYGFGENWDNTAEKEMQKIENGFQAEVNMLPYSTFNFCFRNENYIWDNNYSFNFISPIEDKQEVPEEIQDTQEEPQVQNIEAVQEFESLPEENQAQNIDATQEFESLPEENQDEQIQKIEEEISALFDELFETTEEESNIQQISTEEINNSGNLEPASIEEDFDLDKLIEEILAPTPVNANVNAIVESEPEPAVNNFDFIEFKDVEKISDKAIQEEIKEEDVKEEIKEEVQEETPAGLPVLKDTKHGLVVSSRKLNRFNFAIKKIKLSLYKALVAIPKFLQGQFGSSKD